MNNTRRTTKFQGRVRRLRRKRLVKLEAAAEAAGISPSTLSKIERGIHAPRMTTAIAVAQALGLPSDSIKDLRLVFPRFAEDAR